MDDFLQKLTNDLYEASVACDAYRDERDEEDEIGTCQGCGRYGNYGQIHIKDGEECGQYL